MKSARLNRDIMGHSCILGTMFVDGMPLYTLERPWLDNTHNISCIPTGIYKCVYMDSSFDGRLRNVYSVRNVPDREGILLHSGNFVDETHGCILVGLGRDIESNKIINSKKGMEKLIELMGDEFDLIINQ